MELLATYAGRAQELKGWIGDAHVNGDMDLRLQYMAGMGLNFNNASVIKEEMANYYRYPADMFTGSGESSAADGDHSAAVTGGQPSVFSWPAFRRRAA